MKDRTAACPHLTMAVIVSLIQGLLSPETYGDLVATRFLCLLLKPWLRSVKSPLNDG
jgi:hypothetical protein